MKRFCFIAATLLLFGSGAALAQDGPPPFPGDGQGGPPPQFRGGQGGQRGGGFGRMQPISAATIPTDALAHYLKLSDSQKKRVSAATASLQALMPRSPQGGMRGMHGNPPPPDGAGGVGGDRPQPPPEGANGPMPPPGEGEMGGSGREARPSFEEMEARRKKFQVTAAKADKEIAAVLTPEQKRNLPTLIKALSALRADHIDIGAATKLNLTPAQMKRLAKSGNAATHEDVVSDFTATQNETADANRHEFGGRGGFPGGRGGFPGGPDGMGGPPPGGFGGPPPGGQ